MKMEIKGWACKKEAESLREKMGFDLWNNNHTAVNPEEDC
jgi:hypothetical protein